MNKDSKPKNLFKKEKECHYIKPHTCFKKKSGIVVMVKSYDEDLWFGRCDNCKTVVVEKVEIDE